MVPAGQGKSPRWQRTILGDREHAERFLLTSRPADRSGPGRLESKTVAEKGDKSLLATFFDGCIRLGTTDWSVAKPVGQFITSEADLAGWAITRSSRRRLAGFAGAPGTGHLPGSEVAVKVRTPFSTRLGDNASATAEAWPLPESDPSGRSGCRQECARHPNHARVSA